MVLLLLPPLVANALPAGRAEPKPFVTSLSVDMLFTRGNADKGEFGGKVETEGATPFFESVRGGGAYAYGVSEVNEVESTTAKRWSMTGNARRPWEPNRTYTFVDGKVESDAVAELNYRLHEGGGAGVYLRKKEKETWTADAGLSWVFEETADGSDDYPAVRCSERYEREWATGQKVVQNVEFLPPIDAPDRFLFNADAKLETVISADLKLHVQLEYEYQNRPPEEVKAYDLRMAVGVTAKF